jgi:hypothetical protein
MARDVPETDWTAVIARALGFLCVHQAGMQDETLLKQAEFLARFGIPRSEAAGLLGTSEKSLNEMERQQKARKSGSKKATTKGK